jgi:uncharacterized protein YggE
MNRHAPFAFAALLASAALASPAAAAEVQIQSAGPVVELSVSETVDSRPDIATVYAGVSTRAQTAVAAMQQNAQKMAAVVAKIKALGVADDDIQTTGINLSPQYDYNQATQSQVFRGYVASNRVSVKLRKVEDTGRALDALVAAGANDIGGPDFSVDDDTAYRAEARRNALERAKNQAAEYARLSGYSGVRLLEIDESVSGSRPPMPMPVLYRAEAAQAAPTPVQPGLVGTVVNLTVKYELTR